jgi:hypothetical protein
VLVGVAATPLVVDRTSDRLGQPLPPSVVSELVGEIRAAPELGELDGPLLVSVNGNDGYVQVGDTVGTRLEILDGIDVAYPPTSKGFVHPERLAAICEASDVLVISLLRGDVVEPDGIEVARVDGAPGLDREALARIEEQSAGIDVVLGPDLEAALAALPGDSGSFIGATIDFRLGERPEEVVLVRDTLELLIDHPPAAPELDPDDLIALRDSLPEDARSLVALEVTAHLQQVDPSERPYC